LYPDASAAAGDAVVPHRTDPRPVPDSTVQQTK
jgi:hypothetical protein